MWVSHVRIHFIEKTVCKTKFGLLENTFHSSANGKVEFVLLNLSV